MEDSNGFVRIIRPRSHITNYIVFYRYLEDLQLLHGPSTLVILAQVYVYRVTVQPTTYEGQTFLFSLKPKFHVYEWTRTNSFFMLMTPTSIAMGGGYV